MEIEIVKFFNHWGSNSINLISTFFSSRIVIVCLWLFLAAAFFIFDKKNGKKIVICSAIAVALHFLITDLFFKHIMVNFWGVRLRPYLAFPDINPLGNKNIDSSFPSNHMSSTLAMLTVFVYYYRKLIAPAIVFVLLMALSRMHNGMHYPTDILAGTIIGIILGCLSIFIARNFKRKGVENG